MNTHSYQLLPLTDLCVTYPSLFALLICCCAWGMRCAPAIAASLHASGCPTRLFPAPAPALQLIRVPDSSHPVTIWPDSQHYITSTSLLHGDQLLDAAALGMGQDRCSLTPRVCLQKHWRPRAIAAGAWAAQRKGNQLGLAGSDVVPGAKLAHKLARVCLQQLQLVARFLPQLVVGAHQYVVACGAAGRAGQATSEWRSNSGTAATAAGASTQAGGQVGSCRRCRRTDVAHL